jgi:hypothetical protein
MGHRAGLDAVARNKNSEPAGNRTPVVEPVATLTVVARMPYVDC